jgi:hypothetical protein
MDNADPPQIPTSSGAADEMGLQVAEYGTVRAEWLSSRDAQQHTLQWTLAAIAVLIAGILNSDARTHHQLLYVLLSAAVVAIAACSHAIWFGEVLRMERAALFLRGVERRLARRYAAEQPARPAPLIWETWRGVNVRGRTDAWVPKASASILAGFGLYCLLALAGIIILVDASTDRQIAAAHQHIALVLAIVTGSIYLAVLLYMCLVALKVRKLSSRAANLDPVEPAKMSTDQA